jgi:hypothetical protein
MSWYDPFDIIGGVQDAFTPDTSEAEAWLAKMEPMLHQYYDPYINNGQAAMGTLNDQYSMLLNDPASMQQMLGGGYEQSPGYQYQYDSAMNAGNQQLSAGGMLGTPAAQTQMMGTAQGLANQDYWNYYNQNANLYGQGLQGTQGMFDTGYNATNQMTSGLGNMYGSQANMSFGKANSFNQMLGSMLGGAGGMMGAMI